MDPIAAHHRVDDMRAMLSGICPPPVEGLAPILRCSYANRLSLLGGVKGSLADSPALAALDSALRDERSSSYERDGAT